MNIRSQNGFALLHLLLVLIIVASIVGTGWYVWQSKKETDAALKASDMAATSDTPTVKKTATKPDLLDGWTPYTSPTGQYSINLPNGWHLHRYQREASLFAFGTSGLKVDKSVKAVVEEDEFGKDGTAIGYFLNYADTLPSDNPLGDVILQTKTTAGDLVIAYKYVEKTGQEGIGGIPKDATQYAFVIKHSGRSIVISYGITPTDEDIHSVIEASVQSIKFL